MIGFTVETDGALPSGESLGEAIARVDLAGPSWFVVTCAHPDHVAAAVLDDGDPTQLAADLHGLRRVLPALTVTGGCCGTDERHIAAIAAHWETSRTAGDRRRTHHRGGAGAS